MFLLYPASVSYYSVAAIEYLFLLSLIHETIGSISSEEDQMGNVIKKVTNEYAVVTRCPEAVINNYAVFMGYLSMAVTGLGYIVLTWTTVVLLGGFVSMLEKKDLWSLTVITLVQIAGVFDDVSLNEKLSNIGYSFLGLLVSMLPPPASPGAVSAQRRRLGVGLVAVTVQALMFFLVLCPLAAAYVFGLYISTGVSLWRLIQRDYGDNDDDPSKKNLRPALNVLYSLALLQGVLFCYRAIFAAKKGKSLVDHVVTWYKLDDQDQAREFVADYLRATRIGCAGDPSFARGRKLLTHIVELMESRSSDSYLSGARMLESLLQAGVPLLSDGPEKERLLRKLLTMLEPTNPHGEEARLCTARIVASLAGEYNLEKFPAATGSQCIVSLLEEPGHELALWGVRIFAKLAAAAHNVRVMDNSPDLASKITAALDSHPGLTHRPCHDDTWSKVAWPSLRLISWLMERGDCYSEMAKTLASMLERILHCDKCDDSRQQGAATILFIFASGYDILVIAAGVFARGSKDYARELGRDMLEGILIRGSISLSPGHDDTAAFRTLTDVLVDAGRNSIEYRIFAATFLDKGIQARLFDSTSFPNAMPKVLEEIAQLQERLGKTDIEAGHGSYPPDVQQGDAKLLGALLSLCETMRRYKNVDVGLITDY
ncbi:hypothetical protein ACP70R_046247 [Stipagrostis hirtigluma subsp. patula]